MHFLFRFFGIHSFSVDGCICNSRSISHSWKNFFFFNFSIRLYRWMDEPRVMFNVIANNRTQLKIQSNCTKRAKLLEWEWEIIENERKKKTNIKLLKRNNSYILNSKLKFPNGKYWVNNRLLFSYLFPRFASSFVNSGAQSSECACH